MAELTADLFVTLDGYASGENAGQFSGFGGPELEARLGDVLAAPQLVLMGRHTYLAMAAISRPGSDEIGRRMNELPKAVVSNTLTEPLEWQNTRLVSGDLTAKIRALEEISEVPLRTIGSMALVSSMMQLGLVDVLRITIFPITLGPDGREPIYAGYPRSEFELASQR
jgi:dihydrofolate reductase